MFYLCYEYPVVTQTFTEGEIAGLRARGLRFTAVACRRPSSGRSAGDVLYLPGPLSRPVTSAFARAARDRPATFRRLLRSVAGARYRDEAGRCWLRGFLQVAWGAWLAQRAGGPSHFHAQFLDAASTVAFVAAGLCGGTFSFTNHTAYNPYLPREKLTAARFAVSISEFDRRMLTRLCGGNGARRIRVIYQGIDTATWRVPRGVPPAGDPVRVLSVGALREKKGHGVLLEALARLASAGMAFRATIVGEGPERRMLESQIRDRGFGASVNLAGAEEPAVIRSRLAESDLFVLASRRAKNGDLDGIPISIMEAMAAGVPVVSTRLSGIPELVRDGVEGRLAPPGDAVALSARIREALGDRAASEEMARRGREKVVRQHERRQSVAQLDAALREAAR
ncbi:MAG: glycosyltransferase [Planctomycetes bacterium]|nr:glycosyltransferase [Planctomycetota bacterium]